MNSFKGRHNLIVNHFFSWLNFQFQSDIIRLELLAVYVFCYKHTYYQLYMCILIFNFKNNQVLMR